MALNYSSFVTFTWSGNKVRAAILREIAALQDIQKQTTGGFNDQYYKDMTNPIIDSLNSMYAEIPANENGLTDDQYTRYNALATQFVTAASSFNDNSSATWQPADVTLGDVGNAASQLPQDLGKLVQTVTSTVSEAAGNVLGGASKGILSGLWPVILILVIVAFVAIKLKVV